MTVTELLFTIFTLGFQQAKSMEKPGVITSPNHVTLLLTTCSELLNDYSGTDIVNPTESCDVSLNNHDGVADPNCRCKRKTTCSLKKALTVHPFFSELVKKCSP